MVFRFRNVTSPYVGPRRCAGVPVARRVARGGLHLEHLECRCLLAGDLVIDAAEGAFEDGGTAADQPESRFATAEGIKWQDINGDGVRDPDEPGLAGVVVYSDLNRNGQRDRGEPWARTARDNPRTEEIDETGFYRLSPLRPGEHVLREVVPEGYEQTFPAAEGRVLQSDTGQYRPGAAVDFDLTAVDVREDEIGRVTAELEMTVLWRDTCGTLKPESTIHTVVGDHILVELAGHQVGDACAEVISPQQQTVRIDGLSEGLYQVVGTLHEDLLDRDHVATLNVVGQMAIGSRGQHWVKIREGETVHGMDFGNRAQTDPGAISGRKWLDRDGDGQMDVREPGLAGVTIYLDVNLNGQLDRGEPQAITRRDNPLTDFDEAGWYTFADVRPGFVIVRELPPDGYEQTFPGEFLCDAIFCIGRGHMVTVEPGQSIDGLHFGNRPVLDTATVMGLKWLDANGNGIRERNEPAMAGVVIFADLNENQTLDEGEPQTKTAEDDRSTPINETGLYRLENVPPGETTIREVVPDGYRQTFPPPETRMLQSHSEDLPGGRALSLEWLSVTSELGPDGTTDLVLTFEVLWPDGCGRLLPDLAEVGLEGDRIDVQLYGTQIGRICTLALRPETQTVRLPDVPGGRYGLRTVLMENSEPGDEFARSFVLEGRLLVGGVGGHEVRLQPGEIREGLFFGNQPVEEPDPWLERADFDGNGVLEARDIDLLAAAIRARMLLLSDLTCRAMVGSRFPICAVMVQDALRTDFGDSNLDGHFDSADMVQVFQAGKYESRRQGRAGWAEGDWNGDGLCDSDDIVFVFQEGSYETDSRLRAEPVSTASAVDLLLGWTAADDRLPTSRAWT